MSLLVNLVLVLLVVTVDRRLLRGKLSIKLHHSSVLLVLDLQPLRRLHFVAISHVEGVHNLLLLVFLFLDDSLKGSALFFQPIDLNLQVVIQLHYQLDVTLLLRDGFLHTVVILSRLPLVLEELSFQRGLHFAVLLPHLILDLLVLVVQFNHLCLHLLYCALLEILLLFKHGEIFIITCELSLDLLVLDLHLLALELELKFFLPEVSLGDNELFQLLRVQFLNILDLDAGFLRRAGVLLDVAEKDLDLADF